jgi:hypothetical protein
MEGRVEEEEGRKNRGREGRKRGKTQNLNEEDI